MSKSKEDIRLSDLPVRRTKTLKENVIRINNLLFKRNSQPKQSETSGENESNNNLTRSRTMRPSPVLPSRSESPGNLPNSSKEPNSFLISSRIKRSRNNSPKSAERSKSVLKGRSNTIANIKMMPDTVGNVKQNLKRQESCNIRIVKENREVPSTQKIPISLTDNLLDKIRQKVLDDQAGMKAIQSERNLELSSLKSMDHINKRIMSRNSNSTNIREKKVVHQSLERSVSSQINTQLISLIKATKVDLKEDRKEIKQMMDDHMKDMDQISKKHFKPSFKTRWALAILGRPPEVQFTRLYTCSKPGFKFFKKRFMNSDQEV